MSSTDSPSWARPLPSSEYGRRIVQCGGCGRSMIWSEFVNHLRECDGTEPSPRRRTGSRDR